MRVCVAADVLLPLRSRASIMEKDEVRGCAGATTATEEDDEEPADVEDDTATKGAGKLERADARAGDSSKVLEPVLLIELSLQDRRDYVYERLRRMSVKKK